MFTFRGPRQVKWSTLRSLTPAVTTTEPNGETRNQDRMTILYCRSKTTIAQSIKDAVWQLARHRALA